MKPLVSTPVVTYLFLRTMRTSSVKHCLSQYGRYFSTIKSVQGMKREMFSTAGLDLKTQKNIRKRFSSKVTKSLSLMDFDVWLYPKPFAYLRSLYIYFYKLEGLKCFSLFEISKSSCKALEVVTTLLSQLKFSELEGLVTPECKEQVERNLLINWNRQQIPCLAFIPEFGIRHHLCEVEVLSDENKNQKMFVEIRVLYYVWLPYNRAFQELYESEFGLKAMEMMQEQLGKLLVSAVFNCKFISEIINGSANQWIMSRINLEINHKMIVPLEK